MFCNFKQWHLMIFTDNTLILKIIYASMIIIVYWMILVDFMVLVRLPSTSGDMKLNNYYLAAYVIGSNEQARDYYDYNEYPHYFTEHGDYQSNLKYYNCQGLHHYYSSIGTSNYQLTSHNMAGLNFRDKASDKITNDSFVHDISFDDFPLPVFDSYKSMTNYCLTGDKSGVW